MNLMKRAAGTLGLLAFLGFTACSPGSPEVLDPEWDQRFNFDWRFAKGDQQAAIAADFDDTDWEVVDLPHDWAISGPFGPLKSSGNTGKLPWQGEGWYRKSFELPAEAEGKRLQFLFDGVMASPEIYLNGQKVGSWIYGYNSFWIDATEAARFGESNVLVVHADTREHGSRWYPGAGIYRKVGMRLVEPMHIPVWGICVTTPEVSEERALIRTLVELENSSPSEEKLKLELSILDPAGVTVSHVEKVMKLTPGAGVRAEFDFSLDNPAIWDTEHPELYTCVAELLRAGKRVQRVSETFGIRTFQWTADDGFHLNGRRVQLYGVNLHHDHGPLGAAFFPRAMERQLEIMKNMGVNALRTSHNACAPEVLELCDQMGIIVFNELFDKYGPTAGVDCSTAEYVDKYAEREVRNFVLRDRNHPSVFLWSIGNEIPDLLSDSDGLAAQHVAGMVRYFEAYDTTRPITMGCHIPSASGEGKHILDALETSGWNYGRRYVSTRKAYPEMPLIYSESASAFGTRGAYKLPVPESKTDFTDDGEMTAYMLTSARWSDIPEIEFEYMRIDTFIAGEFVWTGFDYLGEPTPVMNLDAPWAAGGFLPTKEGYEARSSYFGIVDLAGLPKDSYYNYRSLWNKKEHTVFLSPHWNWLGQEGQAIPVILYTDGDEAELFLNGESLGRRKKLDPTAVRSSREAARNFDYSVDADDPDFPYFEIVDAYRLRWMEVPYEPGELKAVAYKDGEKIGESMVETAGEPFELRLTPDRTRLEADGMDLCYVTVEMVDAKGRVTPLAMDLLEFSVEGAARLMGVANGNQMGHDVFTDKTHPLFYGKAVAVLRSIPGQSGEATLHIRSESGFEDTAVMNFI
ncbi:MAG: glycoside hydrolase family 2 TIM barrel-domain containing protein [Bacteroidales bacterium]|nr:glycoside hydrolase family 2 TIM barrel-domain containing protein [Bacteroidales bacterium]